MSRRLRFVPRPMVVEVTCRTVHGRFLLHPSPTLNRLAIGVLARAQRKYEMRVHAFCVMSNHYHLLVTSQNALQLARFMNFLQSNLAREAGRLSHWRERFWGRRYQAILVSDEPGAQLSRLRYILSQACKEGLVARPQDWRGAHCVRELMAGETTLEGLWIDRTAVYRCGRRDRADASKFTTKETLVLTPIPCFAQVSTIEQVGWIRRCVEEISLEARDKPKRHGRRMRDRKDPAADPNMTHWLRRSPAPWFHATSSIWAHDLRVTYALFVAMYRSASEKLKRGIDAIFPEGCFPPPRPYVTLGLSEPPSPLD